MRANTLVKGRAVLIALLLMLAWLCVPVRALAASAETARVGSISLVCSVEIDGKTISLAGDEYKLFPVASAQIDGDGVRYETLSPFAELACDWAALDAAGLRDVARAASEIVLDQGFAPQAASVTDASGRVSFTGLASGMYLVMRSAVAAGDPGTTVDPMLVGVPALINDTLTYNVTAHPKFEHDGRPDGGGGDPTPDGPGGIFPGLGMPTTGDIQMTLVGLLLVAGFGMLGLSRRVASVGSASATGTDEDVSE